MLKIRNIKKTISLAGYIFSTGLFICLVITVLFCFKNYLAGNNFQTSIHMNMFGEAWLELILLPIVGFFILAGLYFELGIVIKKKK